MTDERLNDLDPNQPADSGPAAFWSPWSTVGWGLVISTVFVITQVAVVIVWGAVHAATGSGIDPENFAAQATVDGDLLATGTLVSAVVCGVLVLVLTVLKPGSRPRETLALRRPSPATLARWLGITAGLIFISDMLTLILGKTIVPEFMSDLMSTATWDLLVWVAIVGAAPIFEELFVRGFLLEGLRRGRMGDAGAVILTSLFWASIHLQYGLYEIVTIFVFGLVLGLSRLLSGSLWVPIAMHMMANLVATVEALIVS